MGSNGILIIGITFLLTLQARAELIDQSQFQNPNLFGNENVNGPGVDKNGNINLGGGSGLANSIASPIIQSYDPNQVNYTNQEAADNSRKNAAGTAGKSSGTGAAVHAAIGGTMIGIGTPMTMSIDPVVKAAGIELVTKGIIELAQSGADSGVQKENNDQRDLLTQKANQEGQQAKGNNIENALNNNADLNKLLGDKGINPDSFAKEVANGMTDASDIARALGGTGELSPEQQLAATTMANSQMGEIFADAQKMDPTTEKLGYDETNAVASSDGGIMRASGNSGSEVGKDRGKLGAADGEEFYAANGFAPNHTQPTGDGNKNAPKPFDTKGLLAEIFGADGKMLPDAGQKAMDILGIQKLKKGRNIFMEASYHYRGWGKWRRKAKPSKKLSLR